MGIANITEAKTNGSDFANYIFKCIFAREYFYFESNVPKVSLETNTSAKAKVMEWCIIEDINITELILT